MLKDIKEKDIRIKHKEYIVVDSFLKNEYRTKGILRNEKAIRVPINIYIAETELKYRFLDA